MTQNEKSHHSCAGCMALVCSMQTFCCSAAFDDRVNLRGHLGWLCPLAQASLDNSCYWDEGRLKSRVVKEECKKFFQCGWEQAASFPWHLLEAMVSQFSHFFECSLIYFILWSPWQCLGRGVQLLVGLSFEHEGWQNPFLSCLLLCTSDAQSAPAALSIPDKNLCCEGRSLPRDTVERGGRKHDVMQLTELPTEEKSTREKWCSLPRFSQDPEYIWRRKGGVNPTTHRCVSRHDVRVPNYNDWSRTRSYQKLVKVEEDRTGGMVSDETKCLQGVPTCKISLWPRLAKKYQIQILK